MAEAFDTSSTQASILYNTSTTAEAGMTLAIEDADGKVLLSWDVPCSFSSALVSCPDMEVGGTYTVVIGENSEEITLSEVSASYGDAQSSMYGGSMNWGGMKSRGDRQGNQRGDSSDGSTDSETASETEDMHGGPGHGGPRGGQAPPEMSQSGETGEGSGQMPPEMSQSGETGEGGGQTPPDMSQGGMTGGPSMQDQQNQQDQGQPGQQEQTQAEEDAAAQDTVTAQPVDAKSGAVIGGSAALLAAAVAVVLLYKKH